MNKVFLTGTIQRPPKIAYTPKGKRVLMFPLSARDNGIILDVLFSRERYPSGLESTVGGEILVAGTLIRTKIGTDETFKIEASQILWMEE